jgi:hypothetical protein
LIYAICISVTSLDCVLVCKCNFLSICGFYLLLNKKYTAQSVSEMLMVKICASFLLVLLNIHTISLLLNIIFSKAHLCWMVSCQQCVSRHFENWVDSKNHIYNRCRLIPYFQPPRLVGPSQVRTWNVSPSAVRLQRKNRCCLSGFLLSNGRKSIAFKDW